MTLLYGKWNKSKKWLISCNIAISYLHLVRTQIIAAFYYIYTGIINIEWIHHFSSRHFTIQEEGLETKSRRIIFPVTSIINWLRSYTARNRLNFRYFFHNSFFRYLRWRTVKSWSKIVIYMYVSHFGSAMFYLEYVHVFLFCITVLNKEITGFAILLNLICCGETTIVALFYRSRSNRSPLIIFLKFLGSYLVVV